jgi:hypothetical protein
MEPSKTILQSLQKINAAFAEGLKKGAVDGGLFSTIGREFSTIGETISRLGGGSKQP